MATVEQRRHWLLRLETAWTLPWFLISWLFCSIWYALVAGREMARAESATKQEVLDGVLKGTPKGKPNERKPAKILS